jgi:ribosomal protein S18 acetylase RimI-like enzyme
MHVGGAFALVSGIASNAENGIVGGLAPGAEREEKIAALLGFVLRRGVPASWLLDRPRDRPDDLPAALVAGGCRAEDDAWVMGGPVSTAAPAPPDGVQIVPVATAAGLEDWLQVAEVCGWIDSAQDFATRRRVYGSLPFEGPLRRWTAMRDGIAVGMAAALVVNDVIYMTDSAVIPEARRRGIGRALAATRLRLAAERQCTRAVLAPSPDGAELWRSLGFIESRQPRNRWFYLPSHTRSTLEIAPAGPQAHESILALHGEAGWPGTHVDGEVWAAREARQLVGSIQLVALGPALVLVDAVVVRANARNQGIGAELMRTVMATRAAHWWLECRLERVAFYQRLGFVLVNESEVPAIVKARVGGNRARQQRFLYASTIVPTAPHGET